MGIRIAMKCVRIIVVILFLPMYSLNIPRACGYLNNKLLNHKPLLVLEKKLLVDLWAVVGPFITFYTRELHVDTHDSLVHKPHVAYLFVAAVKGHHANVQYTALLNLGLDVVLLTWNSDAAAMLVLKKANTTSPRMPSKAALKCLRNAASVVALKDGFLSHP